MKKYRSKYDSTYVAEVLKENEGCVYFRWLCNGELCPQENGMVHSVAKSFLDELVKGEEWIPIAALPKEADIVEE